MNQVKQESMPEMKFGDLIEEFIFLIFKSQRREKGIDYFQNTDENEDIGHDLNQRIPEDLGDTVQLLKSPKNTSKRDKALDHKYEMCTVPEESNEDEIEDSPLNRRMLSPGQFFGLRKSKYIDPITLSPIEVDPPNDQSKVPIDEIANNEVFSSPLMLQKSKKFFETSSPELGTTTSAAILQSGSQGLDQKISVLEIICQTKDIMKVEDISQTPVSMQASHARHRQDSKVKIIEKLESKIFKLLKDAKMQISRSKEKGKRQRKEKTKRINTPYSSRERSSGDKNQNAHLSFEMGVTPKRGASCRLPKSAIARTSVPCSRDEGSKKKFAKISSRDQGINSFFNSAGDIHKHASNRRYVDHHLESKKISLSFNLEFTKFMESGKSKSKDKSMMINTDRDMHANKYMISMKKPDRYSNIRKSHNSPRNKELSDSKEGSIRDSSKYSFDTPTKRNIPNRIGEKGKGKLKQILNKIKHGYGNTTSKEQSIVKEKLFKQRSSEGTVHYPVKSSKLGSQPGGLAPRATHLRGDLLIKRREGNKVDSSIHTSHHKTTDHIQSKPCVGGLLSLKNKLKLSLLNQHH